MSSAASETRDRILRAAWEVTEREGPDASLSRIAAEAGVSRQALYLHFGSRAGLLLAAVRHHDVETGVGERFADAVSVAHSAAAGARAWTRVWLQYLPEVAPVAQRLSAAMATDPAADEALGERMEHQRARLTEIFERVRAEGSLRAELTPARAAETLWSLVHVSAWHQLVVECGWSAAEFEASRLAILDHAILGE